MAFLLGGSDIDVHIHEEFLLLSLLFNEFWGPDVFELDFFVIFTCNLALQFLFFQLLLFVDHPHPIDLLVVAFGDLLGFLLSYSF